MRARELEDNIQLKSTQEEIRNVDRRIEQVKTQLDSIGDHTDLIRWVSNNLSLCSTLQIRKVGVFYVICSLTLNPFSFLFFRERETLQRHSDELRKEVFYTKHSSSPCTNDCISLIERMCAFHSFYLIFANYKPTRRNKSLRISDQISSRFVCSLVSIISYKTSFSGESC